MTTDHKYSELSLILHDLLEAPVRTNLNYTLIYYELLFASFQTDIPCTGTDAEV